jgi:hypothetical protein
MAQHENIFRSFISVLDGVEEDKKTFHATVPRRPSFFIVYFMFSTCYMAYFYMEYVANKGLMGATVSEISILGKLWVSSIK